MPNTACFSIDTRELKLQVSRVVSSEKRMVCKQEKRTKLHIACFSSWARQWNLQLASLKCRVARQEKPYIRYRGHEKPYIRYRYTTKTDNTEKRGTRKTTTLHGKRMTPQKTNNTEKLTTRKTPSLHWKNGQHGKTNNAEESTTQKNEWHGKSNNTTKENEHRGKHEQQRTVDNTEKWTTPRKKGHHHKKRMTPQKTNDSDKTKNT